MARLAWLTPGYPPDRGGVSDHSQAMVNELRALGHDVLVCSNPHERGFRHLNTELSAFQPDVVVVAYVPLGFAPRTGGLSPEFTFWCARLATRFRASTVLLAHEVNVPPDYHWRRRELKLTLLGLAQIAQFEVLARVFDCVVFSHQGSLDIWKKRLPGRRLHAVRICSSVKPVASEDPTAELKAAGYFVPAKTILFFGSGHDSVLFDYVEAAFVEVSKIEPRAQLVIIGMDATALRRRRPTLADFAPSVQTLGFVPEREVSLWLQASELVLAPLVEGVNARKTTVMAALQHGRAVVTTNGIYTRGDIPWADICALAPMDRAAFAAMAVACFQDATWRAKLGLSAQADYDANAAARVTAAQLVSYAQISDR